MIRRLGPWLRRRRYRFVILVVLLMALQTAVLSLLGGRTAVIGGVITVLAMAILVVAYVFGGEEDSR